MHTNPLNTSGTDNSFDFACWPCDVGINQLYGFKAEPHVVQAGIKRIEYAATIKSDPARGFSVASIADQWYDARPDEFCRVEVTWNNGEKMSGWRLTSGLLMGMSGKELCIVQRKCNGKLLTIRMIHNKTA